MWVGGKMRDEMREVCEENEEQMKNTDEDEENFRDNGESEFDASKK